jgi:hypothetical protein
VITNFKTKKVADHLAELAPGSKVLIRFGHGWGDTQMFMPAFWSLQTQFPKLAIDLYVECGQEEIFKSYPDKDSTEHDLIFSLDFPMSEGSGMTKVEKCCIEELGIRPIDALPVFDPRPSPIVACHFQGTALPASVNCPEAVAQKIWGEVVDAGMVPIEAHFEHCFHNPVNAKYGFVTSTVRGCKPKLQSLIGLIQHSFAFIGVASGPFVTAMVVMPERTLYLERSHKVESYTRKKITRIDVMNYTDGTVKEWLASMR